MIVTKQSRSMPSLVARGWRHRLALSAGLFAFAGMLLFGAGFAITSAKAEDDARSSPHDANKYARDMDPEDFGYVNDEQPKFFVVDTVVNNSDPNLKNTDTFGDEEVSIAVNPKNSNEIVITAFSGSWGSEAPLWLSTNGGQTWTKEFTVNPPPGADPGAVSGCPCDQTVDFGRRLAGTFLTFGPPDNVFSAFTRNPATAGLFNYFQSPPGTAQATNHLDGVDNADQPWLLVGPQPEDRGRGDDQHGSGNVYVAYDDFTIFPPAMRIAAAAATDPLVFKTDNSSGIGGGGNVVVGTINPGHRLAIDPQSGAVYSLFQSFVGAGAGDSKNINYMLNRSTDGGQTWTLNGSATGIVVVNADSTQAQPKFCTVNALLGGIDHAAVDPETGVVVYVYGTRDDMTSNNRLALRRLTDNGSGGLAIGPEVFVTGQVQAAIPSVAITEDGIIGVFYYTCDGFSTSGFPMFTAHFATSSNGGASFGDHILETFLSPAKDNGDPRQRVLGDYMQVKALKNQFFGAFTGNGVPFGRTISNNDPIFYKVSAEEERLGSEREHLRQH
jgi:hypothetical protein